MLHKSISRTLIVATAILVTVTFSACRITGGGVVVSGGDSMYRYHYYPDVHVYFDVRRRLYFYLSDGAWKVAIRLPHHLRVGLGGHVNVDLRTREPYRFHRDHRRTYPPGHFKRHKRYREHRKWRDRDDSHRGGYHKRKKRKKWDHN